MGTTVQERAVNGAKAPRAGALSARLLIVDDNRELLRALKLQFEERGYRVECCADSRDALRLASRLKPDLIILDIVMPRLDGYELLKTLRGKSSVPTLVLTAKKGEVAQVLGLKLGADDFVTKPFSPEALTARVEAILKRHGAQGKEQPRAIQFGAVLVDPERREVLVEGKAAELTTKEFDLLRTLCEADGRVLSRQDLMTQVWGYPPDCDLTSRTIDQHIARVRKKLGPDGRRILTVTHHGYRMKLAD